jgi:hypothetical protein
VDAIRHLVVGLVSILLIWHYIRIFGNTICLNVVVFQDVQSRGGC